MVMCVLLIKILMSRSLATNRWSADTGCRLQTPIVELSLTKAWSARVSTKRTRQYKHRSGRKPTAATSLRSFYAR